MTSTVTIVIKNPQAFKTIPLLNGRCEKLNDTPDRIMNEQQINRSQIIVSGSLFQPVPAEKILKMSYMRWNSTILTSAKPLNASIRW